MSRLNTEIFIMIKEGQSWSHGS